MTLSLLTQRIHPALRHLVEPDAHLADLGLERVDLWGVQCDIEERGGFEFPREPEWVTVADVLEAARCVS